MKKIIAVIPITILFILLSHNINVNADTHNITGVGYTIRTNWDNSVFIAELYTTDITDVQSTYFYYGQVYANRSFDSYNSALEWAINGYNDWLLPLVNTGSIYMDRISYANNMLYIYNLPALDSGVDPVYPTPPEPPPEPTWYDNMYESFLGVIESIATIATGGLSELVEAFTDFWVVPVGGDEGDMFFPSVIPMVSPTPTPTPIQYQTVIQPTTDPQGNIYYEYKYVYNNPSGTPIITSSPPVNGVNNVGDSFDYPYYENPDNRDNPYKFKIPWFLKLIFGDKLVDETTLDDSVVVIQDYMNDDDINNGVTTVYDGMSAIPTDWLILIGVIASIPLFGCLISRLLS